MGVGCYPLSSKKESLTQRKRVQVLADCERPANVAQTVGVVRIDRDAHTPPSEAWIGIAVSLAEHSGR